MPRPEIVDRAPVEVLLDHRRADIGGARNGRRVAEPLGDRAHHRGDRALRLRLASPPARARRAPIAASERAAPRAEVLGGELLAEVAPARSRSAARRSRLYELALPLVAEQRRAARQREQLLQRLCELRVDDRRPHPDLVLAAKAEARSGSRGPSTWRLRQRRDPVRARLARVALGADAEPALVDQPHRDGADPLAVERARGPCAPPSRRAARAGARQSGSACRTSPAPAAPGSSGW